MTTTIRIQCDVFGCLTSFEHRFDTWQADLDDLTLMATALGWSFGGAMRRCPRHVSMLAVAS